ncbi:hypothetical protein FQA39_LY19064 [Lamprigera yunnana]|nr:hypothetical protein FQA39_LY19064 [Lamprigera yunnana]
MVADSAWASRYIGSKDHQELMNTGSVVDIRRMMEVISTRIRERSGIMERNEGAVGSFSAEQRRNIIARAGISTRKQTLMYRFQNLAVECKVANSIVNGVMVSCRDAPNGQLKQYSVIRAISIDCLQAGLFKWSYTRLENDPREGRLKTTSTPEIVIKIQDMVSGDRRLTERPNETLPATFGAFYHYG